MNLFAPFNSDAYKLGHAAMYADGTEVVYSNLTPRSDRIYRRNATRFYDGKLVVIGLQGAVMEIVENWQKFFDTDKGIAIGRFKLLCDYTIGPDIISVEHLSKLHDLGYLPLEIKTLKEGAKVGMGIPVLTIRNTVKHAFWLVNFLETTLSDLTWKTMTNATIAAEYKAMLTAFAIRTGSPLEGVAVQGHDFSARGMSGPEDAARSGFGPLASFMGTDTLGAILYAMEYYGAKDFVAASVPATEHAVATSNILKIERAIAEGDFKFKTSEQETIYARMDQAGENSRFIAEIMFAYELILKFPKGILSYVMDSFDFWAILSRGLVYLKDVILRRESNGITPGKLVARPDSGDPVEVVCGLRLVPDDVPYSSAEMFDYDVLEQDGKFFRYEMVDVCPCDCCGPDYEIQRGAEVTEAEVKGAVEVLWETFGGTITDKGYWLLDEHIGLIYGDSITPQRCLAILERLEAKGFASGNVVFGIGSYTYQCNTRDTFGFAVKATYTEVNGQKIAIFKDPKTDSNKKSAKGLLSVGRNSEGYFLQDDVSLEDEASADNLLTVLFLNGSFVRFTTLNEIREMLAA